MTEYSNCKIRCMHCSMLFPSSMQFETAEVFFKTDLRHIAQVCHFCRRSTPGVKDNMVYEERLPNGRVTYIEGKDAF